MPAPYTIQTSSSDSQGNFAKSLSSSLGLDLYAYSVGDTGNATAESILYFRNTSSSPIYLSDSLIADGHGINVVGTASTSGSAQLYLDDPFGFSQGAWCEIDALNGASQSCTTGIMYVEQNASLEVELNASINATAQAGSTATVDYWGTFSPGPLQLYDSNMDPIGTFDVTSAASVPEPASATLLGVGLLGLFFVMRRKLKAEEPSFV